MKRVGVWGLCGLVCLMGLHPVSRAVAEPVKAATTEASNESVSFTPEQLEHAQRTIKILDEVYKSIIILVTDKYVETEEDFAAGSAAVLLFKQMSAGETHRVRLIDATGDPYEPANVASDDFEKAALEKIKKGAAQYEQISIVNGQPTLRVMTAVPVVHERCIMCHEHYKDAKDGRAIGAMSYSILIR